MADVQFEESVLPHSDRYRKVSQPKGMAKLVVSTGLARTEAGANGVLIGFALFLMILIGVIVLKMTAFKYEEYTALEHDPETLTTDK